MEFVLNNHAWQRQKKRKVTNADIAEALGNIEVTHSTPKDSTCIVGSVKGRLLKIWVAGDQWPQEGRLTVRSVAWKDEEDE